MNPDKTNRLRKFVFRLQLIHMALLAGLILFGMVAFSLRNSPLSGFPIQGDLLVYLVPLLALAGYFAGHYVYNKMLVSLEHNQELSLKLARYQTASLLHFACLEVPALFALLAYIDQGYVLYLAIAVSLILYLFSRRPTRKKVLDNLPLSKEEARILLETP